MTAPAPLATDLVTRLRTQSTFDDVLCHEAADEIERLEEAYLKIESQLGNAQRQILNLKNRPAVETEVPHDCTCHVVWPCPAHDPPEKATEHQPGEDG